MTEPEESWEVADGADPIAAPPTANPDRVQVPPEGLGPPTDEPDPAASERRPRKES